MGFFGIDQNRTSNKNYNVRNYQGTSSTSVGGPAVSVAGQSNNINLVTNDYYSSNTTNTTLQKTFAPQITIAGEGADVSASQQMPTIGGLDSYTWLIVMAAVVFMFWIYNRRK